MPATASPDVIRDASGIVFDKEAPVAIELVRVPKPEVGMPVLFYAGGDKNQKGAPAIVVATGMMAHMVDLKVILSSFDRFQTRSAVRHALDPDARKAQNLSAGSWDHHPWMLKLLKAK